MFWVQGRVQKSNADLSALLRLLPRVFPRAFPCGYVVARCRRTCFCAPPFSPSLATILGVPACDFATKYDTHLRLFLLTFCLQGTSPNTSLANTSLAAGNPLAFEASPQRHRDSIDSKGQVAASSGHQSAELAVIKLQMENMQLNLQSAHEEIKMVRIKCEQSQSELVDAQMEAVRSKRQISTLTKNSSELEARAKQANERCAEVEEELESVSGEHTNYARMVFRLSKRCYGLLQRWSNFPSAHSTRCCLQTWIGTVRHRRRVCNGMDAAVLRRRCGMKRNILNMWSRTAAARRVADEVKREEASVSGSDDLCHALGIITNKMSISPQPLRSREHSPILQLLNKSSPRVAVRGGQFANLNHLETATANAIMANSLSAGLSSVLSGTSPPPHVRQDSSARQLATGPLDTLQRLKNAYRPSSVAGGSSLPSSQRDSPERSSDRRVHGGSRRASSSDDTGPLAWFLQQYSDKSKSAHGQGVSPHAPQNSSSRARGGEHGEGQTQDSLVTSRFQKLNGLEVGIKTMVNPAQNIIVEAGKISS